MAITIFLMTFPACLYNLRILATALPHTDPPTLLGLIVAGHLFSAQCRAEGSVANKSVTNATPTRHHLNLVCIPLIALEVASPFQTIWFWFRKCIWQVGSSHYCLCR